MIRLISSLLLSGCLPLLAQTITLAEGAPTSLTIVTLPESNPNASATIVLQAVELLPIEITNRTLGQAGDATRSRRLERGGIVRVELPDGGRLLRYRRGGGAFWGFLHIAADGSAHVVLERPGTAGAGDPFLDRIGVSADGLHAAVPEVAGGLWIVRLDGATYASTGTAARLVAAGLLLEETSVSVGSQVVWYQSEFQQVFRCALTDGAVPVDVSPIAQPNAILKPQMAMARDGSRIVYLYGPQQQQRLWTADLIGGASVLPPPPSKYEDPGYLPEDAGEPAMLLNDDGTRLFFVDADVRDELYLLDVQGALPTLQITDDPIFQPYIGVHVLPFFALDKLTVAIGDPNQMDWFRAELQAGGGTVANLTATGSLVQPYPSGTLDPIDAARAGADQLVVEQGAGALQLRRIDGVTGSQAVLQQGLSGAPLVGNAVAGGADWVAPSLAGDRLYAGGSSQPLFVLPPGLAIATPATGPLYSAVWVELVNGWGISAFYLPDGTFVTGPFEFGVEQLCATAAGGVVVIGAPLRYLAPGVYVVLNRPPVAWRRCLSGAGV